MLLVRSVTERTLQQRQEIKTSPRALCKDLDKQTLTPSVVCSLSLCEVEDGDSRALSLCADQIKICKIFTLCNFINICVL